MTTNNLVIIGFMSSGKTSLGGRLAKSLGKIFIDIDAAIEQQQKMTIPAIFQKYGEPYFRKLERQLLYDLKADNITSAVISTGGGVASQIDNVAILRQLGTIIWFDVSLQKILDKFHYKHNKLIKKRPLLQNKTAADISELYHKRQQDYRILAQLRVSAHSMPYQELLTTIQTYLSAN